MAFDNALVPMSTMMRKANVESCSMVRSGPNATFSNQTIFVDLCGVAIQVEQRLT